LLSHLQNLSREYDVSFGVNFRTGRTIKQIHNAVLASDKKCIEKYMMRVLAFRKLLQK